jgi:hypothetical protein
MVNKILNKDKLLAFIAVGLVVYLGLLALIVLVMAFCDVDAVRQLHEIFISVLYGFCGLSAIWFVAIEIYELIKKGES